MTNQLRTFGVAALLAQSLVFFACSSAGTATGTGGTTGVGTGTGGSGTAGASGGLGGDSGTAGACAAHPGSCTCAADNPDSVAGGACASDCQSVSCGRVCTEPCCVTCGIDATGTKTCTCPMPGQPYGNCNGAPPTGFPTGLTGGLCSPQGYAATMPPADAPAGSKSLKGVACNIPNAVCFTADSMTSSERGCICMGGIMHCGSVNHWFTNNGATATPYNQ